MEVILTDTTKVIDNFLARPLFEKIRDELLDSQSVPWFHQKNISGVRDEENLYFTHLIFAEHKRTSNKFHCIEPLLQFIQCRALVRVKMNMYPRTDKLVHHEDHVDYDYPHAAALFSLNTCDGATVIDGREIQSIENRMILFDPTIKHHSTNCTNAQFRANININYF